MKRSAKLLWIGTVFSTIILAAVAGIVVYFTAFKKDTTTTSPNGVGGVTSESNPTDASTSPSDSQTSSSEPLKFDHLSHSVPGFEYRQVDYDGDGFEFVQLDGSRSHTHYIDTGPPPTPGNLVFIRWFQKDLDKQLAIETMPLLKFPVGTTQLGLTVRDNSRDSHTAYASVIVEKPVFPGAYHYYYPSDSSTISISDTLDDGPRPIFAASSAAINFADEASFANEDPSQPFQLRSVFLLTGDQSISFSVDHHGPVRLLVADKVVLESESLDDDTTEGSIDLPPGDHVAQLLYSRLASAPARLQLDTSPDDLRYDASAIVPVLQSIEPVTTTLEGGGSAKLIGIGLQNDLKIDFGGIVLPIDKERSTNDTVFVTVPPSDNAKRVAVRATNKAGISNVMDFEYQTDGKPPIKFSESRVTRAISGAPLHFGFMTGIKYGPDHRYYVTTLFSSVASFEADANMKASDLCQSASLGDDKAILGLAFNPADAEFKLYVSASILEWKKKDLKGPFAWANGEILLVQKDVDGACLGRVGDPLITGLPVTNHDHAVNALLFDNDGKLHIQVGGFTNAGVKAGSLGGLDANPLSGASLIADVNKPGFDGNVKYSSSDPAKAKKASGDVEVYMAGLRNSFGMGIHSNGYMYATDNGASVGYGAQSTSCSAEEVLEGANLHDEVVRVIKGKYAGHPNRNRGRDDPRQCVFRGPEEKSDDFYEGPIATFVSSTNGVMEYTANTFRGQLKGNLLCSKYAMEDTTGKVFRMQLNDDGTVISGPDELAPSSGLSMIMSPFGHIVMPRVFKKQIVLLSPQRKSGLLIPTFIAVMPFRGTIKGGNEVIVTGEDLSAGAVATFDGVKCTDATEVSADKRWFKCKVPPAGAGGGRGVKVGLQFTDSRLNVAEGLGVDYVYMNV